jgi:Ran-binding protein 9/10
MLTKLRIVTIGFCSGHACIYRTLPGERTFTWGYNSHNGYVFQGRSAAIEYGPKFGKDDIVGCGVDWQIKAYFFTLNGQFLGN